MQESLRKLALATKGFMPENEGIALYDLASTLDPELGPWVEIGAWCGKSTVYLGAAAQERGTLLFSVDHHRGSEEQQPGWEHHDPEVVDPHTGLIDTLPFWRATMHKAALEESVVGIIGHSARVASFWQTPIGLLFIDGGHGEQPAFADWNGWSPKVSQGGMALIHDVFENPEEGGQVPYRIWAGAVASGEWQDFFRTGSLRALRRL
jgi:predicted O-methyltransferase YrrM